MRRTGARTPQDRTTAQPRRVTQVAGPSSSPRRPSRRTCLEVSLNWRPIPLPDSSGIAHALSARPSTLQRNLLLDLSAAVGLGAGLAVVGSLLPSMARQQGLGSMGLAAFAAIPFLTSLLGLLAGRIGPRTPTHLSVYRALGAAGLLLVLVAPQPLFIALAMLGFWLAWSLGAPMQQRIWSGIYPSASRGRLLGIVGSGRSLATMTALLAFTFAAAGAGWLAIVAVVAVVGIVSGMAPSRLTLDTDEEVAQLRCRGVRPHRPAPAHAAPHHHGPARLRQRHGGPARAHRHGPGGPPGPVHRGHRRRRLHGFRRHRPDLRRLGTPGQPHQRPRDHDLGDHPGHPGHGHLRARAGLHHPARRQRPASGPPTPPSTSPGRSSSPTTPRATSRRRRPPASAPSWACAA